MRLRLTAGCSSYAIIYPSTLSSKQHIACIDGNPCEYGRKDCRSICLAGPSLPRFVGVFRRRNLPRSKSPHPIPDDARDLGLQSLIFFIWRIVLESSFIASAFALASAVFFAKVESKFVIANVIRWMAVSLSLKMCILQSRMTLMTSLTKDDWFCSGSYRALLGNDAIIDCDSSIPVRIRQVIGDGSCLFQAIASGVLFDKTTPKFNAKKEHDEDNSFAHPSTSEVIRYSLALRALAVETLKDGIANNTSMVLQHGETTSVLSLVSKAAIEYGMTSNEYLSEMQQENVWGGGPEIVALANCLMRRIVLLETSHYFSDENVIYLKEIARFGSHTTSNPIYILSANQRFPMENKKSKNNHFLAVFPSRPLDGLGSRD
ncbi:hypothetical protein ACHAW5_008270 [Stephanodiscus triporus]|uniref:OTU domain-containing protein n=1 Tax=Stephanodiscus triporus TaxID=2934178 RepID=A0ABD3MPB1_9STRA